MDTNAHVKLRLTTRGKAVITAALVLLALAIGVTLTTLPNTAVASTESGSADFAYVVVAPGQTLWSLAVELDPQADPRDLIAEIITLNALESSAVDAGQQLALPERYSLAAAE